MPMSERVRAMEENPEEPPAQIMVGNTATFFLLQDEEEVSRSA